MKMRALLPPLLATLLGVAALVAAGRAGWPGAPNRCLADDSCFCERPRDATIRQPANTWSAAAFLGAGLWIASRTPAQPLYAVLVILIGIGTAFFHASLKWGFGALDYLSMYLFIGFVIAHGVVRAARWPRAAALPVFLAAVVPAAALNLAEVFDTPLIFGVLVATAVAAETAAALLRRDLRRQAGWMLATLACFLTGSLIWRASVSRGPLCLPDSLLQGHAAWHLLCAAATVTLYLYYASETADTPA